MSSKSWNYTEVTTATIRKILKLKEASATRSEQEKKAYGNWAYGIYLGWETLTMGYQKKGDEEYIRNLANSVEK